MNIEELHDMFNEIGYYLKDTPSLDIDEAIKRAIYIIKHASDFGVARRGIVVLKYLIDNEKKEIKLINKYNDLWYNLKYDSNKILKTLTDDESYGRYVLTNDFDKKGIEVNLFSCSFETDELDMLVLDRHYKTYSVSTDSEYKIKFCMLSSRKMKIYHKNYHIATIYLDKKLNLKFKYNSLDIDIINKDGISQVYPYDYIKDVKRTNEIDYEKCMAQFYFDTLDEKSTKCLSMLINYSDDIDLDLLLLLTSSPILIYMNIIREHKNSMYAFAASMRFNRF